MSGQLQTKAGDLDKAPLYVVCADVWDKYYQAKWVFLWSNLQCLQRLINCHCLDGGWVEEIFCQRLCSEWHVHCCVRHIHSCHTDICKFWLLSKQLKRFFIGTHEQCDPPERHCFACIWRAALCLNPIVCWRFSHQIKLSALFCLCACLIKVVSGWNSRYADISIPTACIIAVICFPFG